MKLSKRDYEFIIAGIAGIYLIVALLYNYTGYAIPFFFGIFSFLLLFFSGPLLCFALYFITTFFVPTRINMEYPITYNQVLGLLYLTSFFLWYFRKKPILNKDSIFYFLSFMTAYFFVFAFFGEDLKAGASNAIYLILYFIICLTIAVQFQNLQNVKNYFWIILLITFLAACVGFAEFATGIDLFTKSRSSWHGYVRINAMSANAIVYGASLIFAFPLGYFLFCRTESLKFRILSLSMALFCYIVSLLTFSRQIYIYILVSVIVIALFLKNKYTKIFTVFLVLFGLVFSVYIVQFLYIRFTTAKKHEKDASVAFRIDGVNITKNVLKNKPLTGLGLGSYPTSWQKYLPQNTLVIHYYKQTKRYPDFGYNQIMVEGGIIGFILTISFFIFIIKTLFRQWRLSIKSGNFLRADYIGIIIVFMAVFLLQNMIQDTFLSIRTWLMYAFILPLANKNFLCEKNVDMRNEK